jgi:hypothetical protein
MPRKTNIPRLFAGFLAGVTAASLAMVAGFVFLCFLYDFFRGRDPQAWGREYPLVGEGMLVLPFFLVLLAASLWLGAKVGGRLIRRMECHGKRS